MNRWLGSTRVGIMAGMIWMLGVGCERQPPPPPPPPATEAPAPVAAPAPYAYYYYPDVEVYYYPVTGIYWWLDGGVWISGPRPPPRFVLRDDARVVVNLHGPEPWREHDFVVRQYPWHR